MVKFRNKNTKRQIKGRKIFAKTMFSMYNDKKDEKKETTGKLQEKNDYQ